MITRILVLMLASFVWLATASARDLTAAETTSLTETVAAFDAAMRANDYNKVAETIPPRILKHIASGAGMDVETLRPMIVQQMTAALSSVKINSFGMDVANAIHKQTPKGEPYSLIPTQTEIVTDTGTTLVKSHTLALLDEGRWYLLRVEDPNQLQILRQVYPDFAGEEFPTGSMEAK